ncbi:MAG: hypothetical protein FWF60_03720 [Oscillospiraceae bacterium]|nr:hypothetical protein [Oscillospiraceae bacterium]
MKKLLSVLLAMAMVLGIGVYGMVGAQAKAWEELTWEDRAEIRVSVAPVQGYTNFFAWGDPDAFGNAALRSEFIAGLLDKSLMSWEINSKIHNISDQVSAITSTVPSFSFIYVSIFEEYKPMIVEYYDGTLKTKCDQAILDLDTLFTGQFDSAFLAKFEALKKAAFVDYYTQETYLEACLYAEVRKEVKIKNLDEINAEKEAFEILFYPAVVDVWTNGTLEEITAFYGGATAKLKAIFDKIKFDDGTTPTIPTDPTDPIDPVDPALLQKWWQKVAPWVQWILRYLCFGWIWMR